MNNETRVKAINNIIVENIDSNDIRDTLEQYINRLVKTEKIEMSYKGMHQLKQRFKIDVIDKIDFNKYLSKRCFITREEAIILIGGFDFIANSPHELTVEINYFENIQQLRDLEMLYGIIIKEENFNGK